MFQFTTRNPNFYLYEDYKRRVKSFLDYCEDIFSLWRSLYNLLSFLFSKLYSKSFDKYKIVESILLTQKEKLDKNKKQNTSINALDDNLDDNLLENSFNNENIDNIILNDDINIKNDDKINDITDINDDNNFVEIGDKIERLLPKRRWIDFLINNCFCGNSNQAKQIIISKCKDLVLEYYSIEKVLKNQILFENLIKDYKWNNSKLKNILNNKSFNKIKNNLIE